MEDDQNGFDISVNSLQLLENGGKGEIAVSLRAEPTNNVIINMSNPAVDRYKLESSQLVFTKLNWNIKQKFKVSSIDDNSPSIIPAHKSILSIDPSSDAAYLLLDASNKSKEILLSQINDDVAGFSVSNNNLLIGPLLNDSFKIKLTAQPKEKVIILASSLFSSLQLTPTKIEFDSTTWSNEKTIIVSGTTSANILTAIDLNIDILSELDFLQIPKNIVKANIVATEEDLITINVASNSGGQILPSGSFIVKKNDSVNFAVTPLEAFEIDKVFVDGVEITSKNKFSIQANAETFIKVFFIRKTLIPIPENIKPLPSKEQQTEMGNVKDSSSITTLIDSNLEVALILSQLKLSELEKSDLLLSIKNLSSDSNKIKDLDLPIIALLNLQKNLITESDKTNVVTSALNLLKNTNITVEQANQLLKVMDSILNDSTSSLSSLNKDALIGVIGKINQMQNDAFKKSGLIKDEVLLNNIKLMIEKIDLTSKTDQEFAQKSGASEIKIPQSLILKLSSLGNSVLFFNEVFTPFNANLFLDTENLPLGEITKIEILDSNLKAINISDLSEPITIKIPLSQALLNALKANETIKPMFYNALTNKWSTVGISEIVQTSEFVIFKVNHLTEFALFKTTQVVVLPTPDTGSSSSTTPSSADSSAASSGGGGGGCKYSEKSLLESINIIYLVLYLGFIFYQKRKKANSNNE